MTLLEENIDHLLNVTRSSLLQSGLSLKYQGHLVLKIVYLINRTSNVLKRRTPFEMIYDRIPSSCHLCVFGSLCFPIKFNLHDKLESRAEKCVFI